MTKYQFRSLSHYGAMYIVGHRNEDEEMPNANGQEFYLASEVDKRLAEMQHAWEVEMLANRKRGDTLQYGADSER
jgi:hypothetical protein